MDDASHHWIEESARWRIHNSLIRHCDDKPGQDSRSPPPPSMWTKRHYDCEERERDEHHTRVRQTKKWNGAEETNARRWSEHGGELKETGGEKGAIHWFA
jgi:hypothetical protein